MINEESIPLSEKGKKIYIFQPENISQKDLMILYKISESITMATGDQSLSEAISARKKIFYDTRKTDTLIWLSEIAKRHNLNMTHALFDMYLNDQNNPKLIADILSSPIFETENNTLYDIIKENNLGLNMQNLVYRRLFSNSCPHLLDLESKIHHLVENIVLNGFDEIASLVDKINELNGQVAGASSTPLVLSLNPSDNLSATAESLINSSLTIHKKLQQFSAQ